ncbi:hypothetical protein [Psychrobacter immobilis]|uniref:hypothetical protein n=1 Tax=Psychrobacter immobilis TaxID=498 RepID=UPI001918EFDF|nr:hypothetical protein [Psychrobacter immobilis]
MRFLRLVPFNESNANLVQNWRNSEHIRSNMLDDSIITIEGHNEFLEFLKSNKSKSYFVVELDENPVGTIYFNGIGSDRITWGCYIGVDRVIPGLFILLIVIAIKFSFNHVETQTLHSEVAAHNANPIKVNHFLGIPTTGKIIKKTTSDIEIEFHQYSINRESVDYIMEKAFKLLTSPMKNLINNLNIG